MKVKLVKVGNSYGIIIPKKFLEKFNVLAFSMELTKEGIILRPELAKKREGWEEAIKKIQEEK